MEYILLIEDNPPDAELVKSYLRDATSVYHVVHLSSLWKGIEHIAMGNQVDLVLLDLALDDNAGFGTLKIFIEKIPTVPVVVMTGTINEIVGMQAVRTGAQDFLIKGEFDKKHFLRMVRHSIQRHRSQLDRQSELLQLRTQQQRNKRLSEMTKTGDWEMKLHNHAMSWSNEMCHILSHSESQNTHTRSDYLRMVYSEDVERVEAFFEQAVQMNQQCQVLHQLVVNNRLRHVLLQCTLEAEESSGKLRLLGSIQDVTELRQQLDSPQKSSNTPETWMSLYALVCAAYSPLQAIHQTLKQLPAPGEAEEMRYHLREVFRLVFQQLNVLLPQATIEVVQTSAPDRVQLDAWLATLKTILHTNESAHDITFDSEYHQDLPESARFHEALLSLFVFNITEYLLQKNHNLHTIRLKAETIQDGNAHWYLQLRFLPPPNKDRLSVWIQATKVIHAQQSDNNSNGTNHKNWQKLLTILEGNWCLNAKHELQIDIPLWVPQDAEPLKPIDVQERELRLLVFESQSIMKTSIRLSLQAYPQKMQIDFVEQAQEGLEKLSSHTYDLIMLDIELPNQDGMQLIQQLHHLYNIPIIAMSRDITLQNRRACLEAGAKTLMPKPPSREELHQYILHLLTYHTLS
ncbi:MAG TPA: response regulator [Saprospiraceae bacterium]|nr:response regulator [Saprospiraceae bacterium]